MKFSVIIPCYKVEKYIRECLDSVLAQECQDWEAVCTDDGSPDKTGEILDEYAAKDKRIRVIHQQNAGLSAARNAAVEHATGEWLVYLDSDDLLSPFALKTCENCLAKCPDADVIRVGLVYFRDGENVSWGTFHSEVAVKHIDKTISMFGHTGAFPQMIYKRSVYGDIKWSGQSWCEERPYGAKCLVRAKMAAVSDNVCYAYRLRSGSITSAKMTLSQCNGYLDATREVLRIYKGSGKSLDRNVLRIFLTTWLEVQARYIHDVLPRGEPRKVAWRHYFETIGEAMQYRDCSVWRKFTICMCCRLPFVLVAMVLCYIPDWLKRRGIHR